MKLNKNTLMAPLRDVHWHQWQPTPLILALFINFCLFFLFSRSQLSTFVTVIVSVIDINDNQPLILSSDAIKLPSSDIRLNEPFTKIVAMDKDEGENGRLTYSILR